MSALSMFLERIHRETTETPKKPIKNITGITPYPMTCQNIFSKVLIISSLLLAYCQPGTSDMSGNR